LEAGSLRSLRRANRLLEVGDHANAAVIFSELAVVARDLGMIERAPYLFFQGARAYFLSGDIQAGLASVRDGFDLLASSGQTDRLRMAGARIIAELEQLGLPEAAEQVRQYLDQLGVSAPEKIDPSHARRKAMLPLKCPYCGATLHPDEVEWADDQNAVCAYCGSIVRGD
jgi:hypothetical protein